MLVNQTAQKAANDDATETEKPSLRKRARQWLRSALRVRTEEASLQEALEEAIEEVLEEHEGEEEALAPEEKTIIRNALSFTELTAEEIMTPRTDIRAVPKDITLEALTHHVLEERHTRIPVYADTLDHVEGFIHIKDLFSVVANGQEFDMKKLLRPMIFVPPSMKLQEVLVRMRRGSGHMAVVVDEYGGTDGLLTMEDICEEIVGDIQDEHDEEESHELVRLTDDIFEADARLRIDRLERALGIDLLNEQEEEEFDTVGGLIFFELGRVPAQGEVVRHSSGVAFEVLEADARRIKRVRVARK